MSRTVYSLLPLAGGILVAIQAPVNARLRTIVESPVFAGLVSFAVGTVLLLVLTLAWAQIGAVSKLGGGPWWAYLGGACGTALVVGTLVATPRIGVLATFVAVIVGEVAMAVAIDQFGWFHTSRIAFTWERALGIVLLVLSLVLILRRR
jgi:transporter family-2 protein